jgi:hypothetical protein
MSRKIAQAEPLHIIPTLHLIWTIFVFLYIHKTKHLIFHVEVVLLMHILRTKFTRGIENIYWMQGPHSSPLTEEASTLMSSTPNLYTQ